MSDRLLHTKVSKRKPLTHFPKKEDGHDGDMQIVSINGKGTYLCIKDKSEWKISEKFNPRNKFDTHIFDEITTRKIRGKGGLTASLESKSITTTTQDDGTGISTSSTSVPVFKIGNGTNAGFLTSKGDTSLVLSAGSTTTEMFNNGSISSTLTSTGSYFFLFNTDDTSTGGRVRIYNGNISGDASLNIETKGPNQDVYTRYYHNNSEPASNKSWSIGMDGTDDMLKINYLAGATLASPSSSGNLLTIDETNGTVTAGGFTTTGTWTFDEYTSGTIGITTVQDSGTTFNDNDTSLMTAGAIADKIEGYGYTSVTNHITNDADDTMAGTLTIDKDYAGTTTGTVKGVHIDFDQTGVVAASQTLLVYGLDLDVNTDSPTHNAAANVVAYGARIDLTGNTSTSTTYQTGLDIYVSGGDTNVGIRMSNTDGGDDFKIRSSANTLDYSTWATGTNGETTITTVDGDAAVAHLNIEADGHVEFDNCAVGFDRLEATFSATAIIGSGGTDDTDIDFRLSNKYRLELTGDIAQMNLVFPNTSGNFILVCYILAGGGGDHDVTDWKVFGYNGGAASTTDVMWAGGGAPTFTSGAATDIVSFYWDADEQQCYGVASLAFATP